MKNIYRIVSLYTSWFVKSTIMDSMFHTLKILTCIEIEYFGHISQRTTGVMNDYCCLRHFQSDSYNISKRKVSSDVYHSVCSCFFKSSF